MTHRVDKKIAGGDCDVTTDEFVLELVVMTVCALDVGDGFGGWLVLMLMRLFTSVMMLVLLLALVLVLVSC